MPHSNSNLFPCICCYIFSILPRFWYTICPKNVAHILLFLLALKNLTYLLMVIRVKRNRTFIFYVFSCRLSLFLLQVLCDRWPGENKHSRINEKYAHCNVIKWIVGLHWGRNVPINTSCCNFSNWWQIICMYKDSTY